MRTDVGSESVSYTLGRPLHEMRRGSLSSSSIPAGLSFPTGRDLRTLSGRMG
jgi:hypothetical protein